MKRKITRLNSNAVRKFMEECELGRLVLMATSGFRDEYHLNDFSRGYLITGNPIEDSDMILEIAQLHAYARVWYTESLKLRPLSVRMGRDGGEIYFATLFTRKPIGCDPEEIVMATGGHKGSFSKLAKELVDPYNFRCWADGKITVHKEKSSTFDRFNLRFRGSHFDSGIESCAKSSALRVYRQLLMESGEKEGWVCYDSDFQPPVRIRI